MELQAWQVMLVTTCHQATIHHRPLFKHIQRTRKDCFETAILKLFVVQHQAVM
jgi:hypothetical protein